MLRGIEDVEDAAEGVRAAGVARLFGVCDDIAALQIPPSNGTFVKLDGEIVHEWLDFCTRLLPEYLSAGRSRHLPT